MTRSCSLSGTLLKAMQVFTASRRATGRQEVSSIIVWTPQSMNFSLRTKRRSLHLVPVSNARPVWLLLFCPRKGLLTLGVRESMLLQLNLLLLQIKTQPAPYSYSQSQNVCLSQHFSQTKVNDASKQRNDATVRNVVTFEAAGADIQGSCVEM